MSLRATLQRVLLSTYEAANRSGALDSSFSASLFQRCYYAYKYLVEDPFARLVKARPALFAGGDVLDVGANIGYTAKVFAAAVRAPYRVHAFEPEERNFRWLADMIVRAKLADRIVAHHAAVGATDGTIELWRNTAHHGDHRIATDRLRMTVGGATHRVPLTTLDTHVMRSGGAPVSFVKIDVQGFEPEVLRGMRETIARNPSIHVALELMPSAIEDLGFDAQQLVSDLGSTLPRIAILERDGNLRGATPEDVMTTVARSELGYVDLVCAR